jgi:SAM-dependent methyltransferase
MTTVNAEQIRQWVNEQGVHYVNEAERYDSMMETFTSALFEAAGLRPGERVLDVGCGSGATTIAAAQQVGADGAVTGVDVSPPLLDLARRRAARAGASIEFIEGDAQTYPFPPNTFDALISRNGLMFFDDPVAAFSNFARTLEPAGRLVFLAPQGLQRNEWIMAAAAAAAQHVGMPEGIGPDQPGPLALSDPDRIRSILDQGGFTNITLDEVVHSIRVGEDVEDVIRFVLSMPLAQGLLASAPPERAEAAIEAMRAALASYSGPEGVVTQNNGEWLVTARAD